MEINHLHTLFLQTNGVCTDTRNLKLGSIFFALKGANFNGNEFAKNALEAGCKKVIVDEEKYKLNDDCILVHNVLETLQELATYHRQTLQIPVIGITGSNGKTTTKELIHQVLSRKKNCYATKGNLNNHIGVPLSVLEINKTHEIAVIEMGANHVDEIRELCEISQPNFGIITNIGKAHLEGFGSFEGVKKAKSELYDYIFAHDGISFINADNPILTELNECFMQVKYGAKSDKLDVIGEINPNSEHLSLFWKKKGYIGYYPEIKTHLLGEYNFENVLAAVTIGSYFEIDPIDIQSAIEEYHPTNNRSQLAIVGTNKLYLDAYNANPVSMSAAIDNLSKVEGYNKMVILGDMRELGEYSAEEHQKIIEQLKMQSIKNAILVGEEFCKTKNHQFSTFHKIEEAEKEISASKIENSVILIKGSRGIALEKLIPFISQ